MSHLAVSFFLTLCWSFAVLLSTANVSCTCQLSKNAHPILSSKRLKLIRRERSQSFTFTCGFIMFEQWLLPECYALRQEDEEQASEVPSREEQECLSCEPLLYIELLWIKHVQKFFFGQLRMARIWNFKRFGQTEDRCTMQIRPAKLPRLRCEGNGAFGSRALPWSSPENQR